MHEMAKIYEQHFKDGSGNTRDLRWMSGLYFFIRIAVLTSTILFHSFYLVIALYVTFAITLLFAICRPYREDKYNNLDTMWFAILTIVIFCGLYQLYFEYDLIVSLHVLIGIILPLLYFVLLLGCKFITRVLQYFYGKGWIKCFKQKRSHPEELEQLPDRLVNSSEYSPLLPAAQ
jgi:hypothetical protein